MKLVDAEEGHFALEMKARLNPNATSSTDDTDLS
jgi:hypothetical protein